MPLRIIYICIRQHTLNFRARNIIDYYTGSGTGSRQMLANLWGLAQECFDSKLYTCAKMQVTGLDMWNICLNRATGRAATVKNSIIQCLSISAALEHCCHLHQSTFKPSKPEWRKRWTHTLQAVGYITPQASHRASPCGPEARLCTRLLSSPRMALTVTLPRDTAIGGCYDSDCSPRFKFRPTLRVKYLFNGKASLIVYRNVLKL